MTPTTQTYAELQQAFDHFNAALFDGQLPPCLMTLQRQARVWGFYSAQRFVHGTAGDHIDEIAINPAYIAAYPLIQTLQTITHEQTHAWQNHLGRPGRRGYHNTEWADKMEAIGLMPSHTGAPGGRRTGEKMSDYPIPGGRFLTACEELVTAEFTISWLDRFPAAGGETLSPGSAGSGSALCLAGGLTRPLPPPKPATRTRFMCPGCKAKVWAKPGLEIDCRPCGRAFQPTER